MSGLRERKKLESRRAIQRAALELTVAAGASGTTVEEIAARANVSTRTFFNYFPSKESALFNAYVGRVDDLVATVIAEVEADPTQNPIRVAGNVMLRSARATDPEIWQLQQQVLEGQPDILGIAAGNNLASNRAVTDALCKLLDVDDLTDRMHVARVIAAMSAVIRTTVNFYLFHNLPSSDIDADMGAALDGIVEGMAHLTPQTRSA